MKRLGPLFGATALTATLVLQGCGTGTGELVVKVRADTLSLRVNETVQLIAEGQKGSDTVALGTVTYSTSDQTVADVDPNTGLVSAKGTGTATLTATSEGRSGQLSISVAGAAHRGNIRASETWRAKDNPHSVLERVDVEGSTHPVVTLEPGVIVRFTAHTGLYVGTGGEPGSLEAEGTAQAPIQFVADTASPTPGFWQGLIFGAQCGVDSVLRQAKLTHCGADPELAGSSNPCIRIVGGNTRPVIADVSIQNSGGSGVEALEDAGFGDGSARVSVSDSAGYPFLIEPNQAHTLPTGGTLSNNAPNMVYIFDGPVLDTQSWPLLGVPYVAGGGINIGGPNSPMLTLPYDPTRGCYWGKCT
ncbi:MAG: Ig-like domain-containing protein, partial [Archangium sp.]